MMLEMDAAPPIGTRVRVDLALGEWLFEVQGDVVRHEARENGRTGVGVRFERLTPRAERLLRDYLLKAGK
jgi:hypothetical protein